MFIVICLSLYVTSSYARIHETACTPCMQRGDRELSSDGVNAELALWVPTYDYGSDSVFGVTPPQVSPEDEAIYHTACSVAEFGSVHVPQQSLQLYAKYIKQWADMA